MSSHDPHEQYRPHEPERYSRDKNRPRPPGMEPMSEEPSLPLAAWHSDQPPTPRSASLQRASTADFAPAQQRDAPATSLRHISWLRRVAPNRLLITIGLLVVLVSITLLAWSVLHQNVVPASTLQARADAATQVALNRSTLATQTAVAVAPLQAFSAQVPGPCPDARHWSYSPRPDALDPTPLTCLADGVELTAITTTASALSYSPIVTFGFPGGVLMEHYRVSLTFSALHITPSATILPPCVRLGFASIPTYNASDGITLCQNGHWFHDSSGFGGAAQSGRCTLDPQAGFLVQVQVDADHITYFCNTTQLAQYARDNAYLTDHVTFALEPADQQPMQFTTSTVKVSNFSYTPLS